MNQFYTAESVTEGHPGLRRRTRLPLRGQYLAPVRQRLAGLHLAKIKEADENGGL